MSTKITDDILISRGFELNEFHENTTYIVFEIDNFFIIRNKHSDIYYYLEAGCFLDDNYYEPSLQIEDLQHLKDLYKAIKRTDLNKL